jgi:hypothetical protein
VLAGLILATIPVLLGIGAGYRQFATLRRVRSEPYMPDGDRHYFQRQGKRRLAISGLLVLVGVMIYVYYLSGMDARVDAIPERNKVAEAPPDDAPAQDDRQFTLLVVIYWIVIILIMGVWVWLVLVDLWATRRYWMARYKEIKADHETKLHRDLAIYRQQKLNERVKGLKKADDDTSEDAPVEE